MSEKKNVPKLRFPEFTEPWEQRKLGDVLVLLKDGTHGTHKDSESGPLLLSAKNIKNGTIQWDESDRRISEDEYNNIHSNFKLQKGDVLLTIVGSIGETAILSQSKGVTFQRSVAFLRPSDKISSEFLYSEIQGQKFQKALNVRKSTSAQPGIYLGDLGTIPIEFPTSDEEQMQIGSYFQNLDNLITLHQRKLDHVKDLKKSMLQKMFPKNGQLYPEVRFPEFTDAWEQRKLGEISDKVTKKNQDVVVDEVFTNSAEYGIISQRDFFDKDIANTENIDGYYVVEPNDFVYNPRISTTAPFGPIKRNKLERSGAMSPLYYVFRPNNVDLSYLEWFFQTSCWYPFMRFNGNSGARSDRFAITDKIFNEMPISLPQDIEEQKRIGIFLTTLDTLITLHQRELDHLKLLKKGMLQQMFV